MGPSAGQLSGRDADQSGLHTADPAVVINRLIELGVTEVHWDKRPLQEKVVAGSKPLLNH